MSYNDTTVFGNAAGGGAMRQIKAIVFDYDGTIVDSFSVSRIMGFVKLFCFRYFTLCYLLFEAAEIFLHLRWPIHPVTAACMRRAREAGLLVGIATDRSLWGIVTSARRSDVDLHLADVIRVRASIMDRWIRDRSASVFLRSRGTKDLPRGLGDLGEWLTARRIAPSEVLFIGDDQRDRRAALNQGFSFVGVDRHNPDLAPVYRMMQSLP